MHCPRCGQQQISAETKFCSRCGFQLGLVAELLTHGGFLPQLAEVNKGKAPFFSRKNGLIFTSIWFIFFLMMTAFFGMLGGDDAAGLSAIFGLFSTLMLLIISFGLLKKAPKTQNLPLPMDGRTHLHVMPSAAPAAGELPPQQQQPAEFYTAPHGSWRAPDTGELVERGSVTENTTRLLDKDR